MLKTYPKYKDSGVSWIGMVPQGWEVVPLKRLCSMKAGCNLVSNDINPDHGNYHVYGGNGIRGYYNDYNVDGAVILVGRQGALCGNVHKVNGRIWATEHAIITKVIHATTCLNYLYWLLNAMNLNQYANDTAAQPGLAVNTILNIKTLLPPRPEQDAIVAYLGDKTAKIDRLIGLYKREIELLQERRQAVIHEAVTRGLDKQTKLKDSGVSWIGKVPVGWEVKRLKRLFSFGKGLPITKADLIPSGLAVISYGQIHSRNNTGVCIKKDLFRYVDFQYSNDYPKSQVKQGDFIFADTSEDIAGCGNCVYIDTLGVQLFAGYHSIILHHKDSDSNKYLAYLFKTDIWRKQIREKVDGVKVYSISRRILDDTTIILPPRVEQDAIVAYLDEHCSKVDAMVMQLREQMEYLDEYRSRLISDVVTGKVRV